MQKWRKPPARWKGVQELRVGTSSREDFRSSRSCRREASATTQKRTRKESGNTLRHLLTPFAPLELRNAPRPVRKGRPRPLRFVDPLAQRNGRGGRRSLFPQHGTK